MSQQKDALNQSYNELKSIDKKYKALQEKIASSVPRATNAKIEKEKFFSQIKEGNIYNPQFQFDQKKIPSILKIKFKKLYEEIQTTNDVYGIKKLYKQKIQEQISLIDMLNEWGNSKSTDLSIKLKNKPNLLNIAKAKLICKKTTYNREISPEISVKKIGAELRKEVKRLTGDKITISYEDRPNKVAIICSEQKIILNPHMKYTRKDLNRLKVHEIGTHYLRAHNGKKTGLYLLEKGTANYLGDEEGLAVCMEKIYGVSSDAQMRQYAGRLLAINYSLKKSFYETYQIMRQYGFSKQDSYILTHRAKRNLQDTSKPGCYAKDHIYFSNYKKVMKHIKKHGLQKLFTGKIKTKDVKKIHKFIELYHQNNDIYTEKKL